MEEETRVHNQFLTKYYNVKEQYDEYIREIEAEKER